MKSSINNRLDLLLAEARAIRLAMTHGALSYPDAQKRVEPLLKQVNRVGEKIAETYGRKYKKIRFSDL